MKTHMQFDNHDDRIRYYELLTERDLDALPRFPLPEGYRFAFFRQGDRDNWIDIELSAKELMSYGQGLEVWNRYYGGNENALSDRMVFIENAEGEKVCQSL